MLNPADRRENAGPWSVGELLPEVVGQMLEGVLIVDESADVGPVAAAGLDLAFDLSAVC